MEKTTKELMEEKEQFNKDIDEKIYESMQVSMAKSRAAKAALIAAKQKYEDDGWNSSRISPHQPVIVEEEEIVSEAFESEPEPIPEVPEPPKIPEVDPKEAELIKLREQLASLQAAVELQKGEKAEIIENYGEEDGKEKENT